MKCPHADIQCAYLDTAGMDKPVECNDCPHYKEPDENGIRATGATPFLAWLINKWKYRKVKSADLSKSQIFFIIVKQRIKAWINHFLRFRTFTKDGITIKARKCKSYEKCRNCFFGTGAKGNDCNNEKVKAFGVPDCVYDYPIGHSVIYFIKKIQPLDPVMYECTCSHCHKKFSSSVPGFTICPNCY